MSMKKITSFLAFLMLVGLPLLNAQPQTISGKVTSSEDGSAVPGASIVVKGTTTGTMTAADGTYSLKVPEGAETLVVSFVGMKSKEVPILDMTEIDIQLDPEVVGLEEVVVTALGISKEKKALGYAVQEVKSDEVTRAKNENLINSLAGKVSGVQIKTNTNFGGSSNIIVRGSSSLTGNNQALFVIDGIPISNMNTNNSGQMTGRSGFDYGNPISDINPDDIESISVLKGAAATALYGSRAANGVIIISTKKGSTTRKGTAMEVNVNHSTMFHTLDKSTFPEHQTEYGAGYGPFGSGLFAGEDPASTDYPELFHYDFDGDGTDDYIVDTHNDGSMGAKFDPNLMVFQWDAFYPESPTYLQKSPYVAPDHGADYFFDTGHTIKNSIDVKGGTTVSTFRLAYANTDQTGMMPNSERKKNSLNLSGSYNLLDNLEVSANAIYSNTYTKGRNHTGYSDNLMSMFRQWYNVGADMKMLEDYYDLTGKNLTHHPQSENDLSPIYWDNPYWQRFENYQDDERDRLIGYAEVNWAITSGLNFMGRYSMDHYNFVQQERKAVGSVSGEFGVDRPEVTSGYDRNDIFFQETNFDALLNYNRSISQDIDFTGMVGTNIRRSKYERVKASTNGGLAVPSVYSLGNSIDPMLPPEERSQRIGVNGIFADIGFSYDDMFFLDGTVRRDVSSTLPSDNNAYIYPSVSSSLIFSELINSDFLSFGKLRVNWAQVGKDAPWGRVNDAYRIDAPFNGRTMVQIPSYKNNPDLKPEISTDIEAGLNVAVMDGRIGLDVAVYQKNSVNQIVPLSVSRVTGFASKYVNVGEIQNQGLEILASFVPVKTNNFKWDVFLNWSKNINQVVSLGDQIENLQLAALQGGVTINAREGEPYGTIQGTDYIYSPDGRKVVGSDGFYEVTATSDKVIGNINPDWNAGITNTLSYKGLHASFLIDMQMGGDIFSLDQWYGQGTGLYPNTIGNNDLGNPKRDPVLDPDGNRIWPFIGIPGYNPEDGYSEESGGIIKEGVVGIDNDDDGEYDEYVENKKRIDGNTYTAYGFVNDPNAAFIYDASYVKLREVSIGYTLPKSILKNTFVGDLTISLVGSNLWIIHKNLPYADPEASQGSGNIQGWQSGVYPTARNYGFKVDLTF